MRIGLLGVFTTFALACAASNDVEPPGDTATGTESSGGGACIPGYEGCACAAGECLQGLQCLSDLCVMVPDVGESSTDDEASASSSGTEPESESSGMEPLTDTSTGADAATTGESSTTEIAPECMPDEVACEEGSLSTCVDGAWTEETCTDVCAATGYFDMGCADAATCLCEGFSDPTCEAGVTNYCACYEVYVGMPCDAGQIAAYYGGCFDGSDPQAVACFADYPGIESCDAAVQACL
jgi:hypothetical protein